ncbi:MAG: GvpL/GvpF family gas vesicle protein, partial [Solirubrobacteraceae bacterium]
EGGVREMLSREAVPLQEAIEQLDGGSEWAVKVFADVAAAGGSAQADDASGAAYMERLQNEGERRERTLAAADGAAAQIHDRLSAVAGDARVIPLQRSEVSGHAGEMILNGVYLVADEDAPAFHEHVAMLGSEYEEHGIRLVLTGPWPAYNFIPATIGAAW